MEHSLGLSVSCKLVVEGRGWTFNCLCNAGTWHNHRSVTKNGKYSIVAWICEEFIVALGRAIQVRHYYLWVLRQHNANMYYIRSISRRRYCVVLCDMLLLHLLWLYVVWRWKGFCRQNGDTQNTVKVSTCCSLSWKRMSKWWCEIPWLRWMQDYQSKQVECGLESGFNDWFLMDIQVICFVRVQVEMLKCEGRDNWSCVIVSFAEDQHAVIDICAEVHIFSVNWYAVVLCG